jgi:alpha-L-rhamnosidase
MSALNRRDFTPGFESIVIRPVLDERVSYGGGEYDSVMGRISTYWAKRPDGSLAFEVTVPANATARIYLPAQANSRIEEQGVALKDRKELRILDRLDGEVVVEAGSGTYSFIIHGLPT